MNYEKLYFKFIDKWKRQQIEEGVYTEKHHILPRHCGGGDEETNLVELTYKQHTFAHRLLWKAYQRPQDLMAWKMMSGIAEDKKFYYCQMAGKVGGEANRKSGHMANVGKKYGPIKGKQNVESGFLDEIRHLANNEKQRSWARELGRRNVEEGQLHKASLKAAENRKKYGLSDKQKSALDQHNTKMRDCPKAKDNLRKQQKLSVKARKERSKQRSENTVLNAERNEEFLNVKPRGKYWYISPEGIKFGTAVAASKYYGTIKNTDVQNWCIREEFGWRREEVIK